MLLVNYYFLHVISLLFITGIRCDELTAFKKQESSVEGSTFTLSDTYHKTVTTEYVFWYRQLPGEPPKFLISHYGKQPKQVSRLSVTVSGDKQLDLQVSSAEVADSALYYCAVRPNQGTGKITFGAGTSVTITTSEVYEPSYYLLDENDKKVCLATGFSQHDQHKNSTLFSSTTPARISGDSLFSQVAFNASDHNCMAAGGDGGSVSCEDKMKPDPTVNLVSVTVLGLRLIFLKTIVFNVFLTFRLWHSR